MNKKLKPCRRCGVKPVLEHWASGGMWEPYQGMGYWFVYAWIMAHSNIVYHIPNLDYYIQKYSTDETRRYLDQTGE